MTVAIALAAAGLLLATAAEPAEVKAKNVDIPWAGPSRFVVPGPGPRPGQSLQDYFENLKTGPRGPSLPHVLVLGGARGFHHDSISTGMASILRWGAESGRWDAELATDFTLVNAGGGKPMNAGFQPKGLKDFDAVVVLSAEGDWGLTGEQKEALLSFVRDNGKGLVVIHGGIPANPNWPAYAEMVGAAFAGHPFNSLDRVVRPFSLLVEDTSFPGATMLPKVFTKQDELYVLKGFSRRDISVVLRMDETRLDFAGLEDQVPPDGDIPVAWTKAYGSGRVFATSLGHTRESFYDPEIARLLSEAIAWSLGLSEGGVGPHPKVSRAESLQSKAASKP